VLPFVGDDGFLDGRDRGRVRVGTTLIGMQILFEWEIEWENERGWWERRRVKSCTKHAGKHASKHEELVEKNWWNKTGNNLPTKLELPQRPPGGKHCNTQSPQLQNIFQQAAENADDMLECLVKHQPAENRLSEQLHSLVTVKCNHQFNTKNAKEDVKEDTCRSAVT
jgi:hypothetical protein